MRSKLCTTIILGLLLTVASTLALAQTVPLPGADTTIKSTWTPPGPVCSTTVTTSCLFQYEETLTPPTGVPGPAPVVTFGTAGVPPSSWKPGGNLYCGNWSVTLVAVWKDANGLLTRSTPASTGVNEPCPFVALPVTGFSVSTTP